jgi:hypothetical protein
MTPNQHHQKADAIMARVDEMNNPELRVSVALTAQAHVHALLAQCPDRYDDDVTDDVTDYPWRYRPEPPMVTRRATEGRL